MTRYVLPLSVSVLIALSLAIEGLFEGIEMRKRSCQCTGQAEPHVAARTEPSPYHV